MKENKREIHPIIYVIAWFLFIGLIGYFFG